jgi:DNA-binding NtrC family response regulator
MEHMVVLLDPGCEVQPTDIPYLDEGPAPRGGSSTPAWPGYSEMTEVEYHVARERVLANFEMHYISELIDRAGANMSKAAKIAGVDRTTLYRLLEKHGLQRDTVIRAS